MKRLSPYTVPPFNGKVKEHIRRYTWWSWHPLYPYWSKSCWGGSTIAAAKHTLTLDVAHSMTLYHNKLIREDAGGKLVEVLDRPCKRLDVWQRIADKGLKPGLDSALVKGSA